MQRPRKRPKEKHNYTVAKKPLHCYHHLILSCTFHFLFSASVDRFSPDWWTWTFEALKWMWTVLFIYCQKSVRKIDRYLAKCYFLVSYKTNNPKLWLRCGGSGSEAAVHKNNTTNIYKTREKYRENICRPFCSHLSSHAPPVPLFCFQHGHLTTTKTISSTGVATSTISCVTKG